MRKSKTALCIMPTFMKRFATSLFVILLTLSTFATGQESNVLYMDGEKWKLLAEPVCEDTVLFRRVKESLPKNRIFATSNWNGYTSYWSIRQEKLFLDSICVEFYDKETGNDWSESLDKSKMQSLFGDYMEDGQIMASWFTGNLRLARGKCIRYNHMGYDRNYENETILAIEKGHLKERKDYQNRIIEGLAFGEPGMQKQEEIKAKLQLHPEKYPELAKVKQITFSVEDMRVDSLGHVTQCSVKAFVSINGESRAHEAIAEDMKQAIMAVHPWKIMWLHGEYIPYANDCFTFRYPLDK